MAWSKAQAKIFVKQVMENVGEGWRFMTPEVREAMIAQRALQVVQGQAADTVKVLDIDALVAMMMQEAGL